MTNGSAGTGSTAGTLAVEHVGITVADLEASVVFYRDVAGLIELRRSRRPVGGEWFDTLTGNSGALIETAIMGLGDMKLQLVQYVQGATDAIAVGHSAAGSAHICLVVDDVMAKHQLLVQNPHLHVTPLVDLPNTPARSFYVRDPDGVPIEFLQFLERGSL